MPLASAGSTALIDVAGLDVELPHTGDVLAGLSCAIPSGSFVAVVGPSGCGKSTFLRTLAGLVAPSGGHVHLGGLAPREARRQGLRMSVVFQQPALLPWRSVARNVLLPIELGDVDRATGDARARELLVWAGMQDFTGAMPHELSGGMRMRVALVRALMTQPRLLLLDEPFAALDFMTREDLQIVLRGVHVREGLTTVIVTHDVTEATFLADRVLVMSARPGRIIADVSIPLGHDRGARLRTSEHYLAAVRSVRERLQWGHA